MVCYDILTHDYKILLESNFGQVTESPAYFFARILFSLADFFWGFGGFSQFVLEILFQLQFTNIYLNERGS